MPVTQNLLAESTPAGSPQRGAVVHREGGPRLLGGDPASSWGGAVHRKALRG